MLKVSFVIPTYNRLGYLKKAISSIENQTDLDYEIIVSENNCTDSTKDWLEKKKNINTIYHEEGVPVLRNWNDGVKKASGEYVVILSDDDIVYKDMVADIRLISNRYSDLSMIVFNHSTIDENDNLISKYVMKQNGLYKKPEAFGFYKDGVDNRLCSMAIRRETLIKCNYLNEEFKLTASDSELIQKASILGDVYFENSNDKGSFYRIWRGSETHNGLLLEQWHHEIELWCNNMTSFTKKHINYDFTPNKNSIVFNNYYSAIINNMKYEKRVELRKLLKKMPRIRTNIKFSIIKMIINNDLLFVLYSKYKDKTRKMK